MLLRAKYLVDVQPVTKMMGLAFSAGELVDVISAALDGSLREGEQAKTAGALAAATYHNNGGENR